MTLVLNTAKPAFSQDWVGVGINTAGPVLLMLVAEGAGSFQRQLTEIIRDLQAQLADAETPTDEAIPATGTAARLGARRSPRMSRRHRRTGDIGGARGALLERCGVQRGESLDGRTDTHRDGARRGP